ncbi:MAG TPA: mycofactocin biosynthesis glycosyltransferase MftF [Ktedonobacteraceae bacterium]|nr:mycofactocin biosynthesis glycosyltransferase MftF [Ktedonobacteraceae bacterium]
MKQSKQPYRPPAPDCYRLTRGIRIVQQETGALAISSYPLRVVKLTRLAGQTLCYFASEHTCEELAQALALSPQKARALCQQLWRKDLLEAGPALPPIIWPHISIIIPSYNRAAQLERCLRSLYALDYPQHHLEIIVVDDASTDETVAMLDRLMQEPAMQHCPVRIITHTTRQGVAISRNTGAQAAKHDLLAYIDSDCVASPKWLTELVPALQDTHLAAIGGMLRSYDTVSTLGHYEDVRSSLFMGMRPQQVRFEGPLTYLPTASMLVRREAWQHIGGFAPLTFGEDVDFCRRLLTHNFQILYLPQGTVYHDYRTQPKAFLSIRVSYASAEAALLQRHPTERRILLLPPEQAAFAALAIVGLWGLLLALLKRESTNAHRSHYAEGIMGTVSISGLPFALLLTLFGAHKRHQQIRKQRIPINPFTTFWATLRSNMAYTYHLCRHLTRYYTLPLLIIGLLLPPLLLLELILCGIIIGVDYARLRPEMDFGRYALWSVLDDCAYEVGVVRGCIKHRTWKPLVPVVRKRIIREVHTPGL